MTEEQNPSQAAVEGKSPKASVAAAVIGGYVLGRTKKGGAALSLASWLSGNQAGPQAMAMARKGLSTVAKSEQVAEIMQHIRGPLLDAAQKAVLSRVTAISDQLTARMQALSEVGASTVEGAAGTVADTTKRTVKGTASTVGGTTKRTVKGTAGTVADTTKKAGGRVQGALGRLTRKKGGKAEEPMAEEEKPEEEANEGVEDDGLDRETGQPKS